jgi:chemotaxis receptor (MCP) glutamine deamidase CheD
VAIGTISYWLTIGELSAVQPLVQIEVDGYRVARDKVPFRCELNAAIAVCVYDDTQGVGGLLHLRFVPNAATKPTDLTDNTLSSDLLLLDRFCKDLRSQGARKQSWRVQLIGHIPVTEGMETPAATLLDLLRAYFADSRLAVDCKEVRRDGSLIVLFDPREGKVRLHAGGEPPLSN